MDVTHNPAVFETGELEAAKGIILTPTSEQDTETRWTRETPYMVELLGDLLKPTAGQVILDYGCGIGRLSKALIERFGCRILGVDTSVQMRALAPRYVEASGFSVVTRYVLQGLVERGFRADAGFSVWVLQHCIEPAKDVGLIRSALAVSAPLAVVNMRRRALPTVEHDWVDDGQDVRAVLVDNFAEEALRDLDPSVLGENVAAACFAGLFRRAT